MSITIRKYENRHPLLGRHVRHDSRSLEFPFPTADLHIKSVVHARHIPILDQVAGSCTANAGIGNLATTPLFEALPLKLDYTLDEPGALQLYSDEETLDGDGPYPPNDFGSDGLTCAKVLKAHGLISAYQHCFDARSALLALSVTPFMFGTDWTTTMFSPDADGRVHPKGNVEGGHEILCREYDAEKERLWLDNSWGLAWGLNGRFYLTLKDFEHLLKRDGDIVILLPLQGLPSSPTAMRRRRRFHHHHHGEFTPIQGT